MKNEPAFPFYADANGYWTGLTKRELACIELCVPDSGDMGLDLLIRAARRERFAAMALTVIRHSPEWIGGEGVASEAVSIADALIAELEKGKP